MILAPRPCPSPPTQPTPTSSVAPTIASRPPHTNRPSQKIKGASRAPHLALLLPRSLALRVSQTAVDLRSCLQKSTDAIRPRRARLQISRRGADRLNRTQPPIRVDVLQHPRPGLLDHRPELLL